MACGGLGILGDDCWFCSKIQGLFKNCVVTLVGIRVLMLDSHGMVFRFTGLIHIAQHEIGK